MRHFGKAGKERASTRLAKEAKANGGGTCDVYECYSISDDSFGNELQRAEFGVFFTLLLRICSNNILKN
jgi:hypothetical protein